MSEISSTRQAERGFGAALSFLLNLCATIHVVWFYLTRVECHIKLAAFEQGSERTPFQYRLLLMEPLRWAHYSAAMNALAAQLTAVPGFFPNGVRPEGLLQSVVDLISVAIAGLVARKLYQLASPTGLLLAYVYPLTLLMVLSTYALFTMHSYRFIYDLPSLALFSLGLLLIYTRAHVAWFAAVFLIGTINRETTLLLILFFMLAQCSRGAQWNWKRLYCASTLGTALPFLALWVAWHVWVVHLYRTNPTAYQPRLGLNLGILAVPITWPQLLATCSYILPLVIFYRSQIHDTVLRAWLWALPVWLALMLHYGVLIEIRIFGELIPYVVCVAALIAEETLRMRLRGMDKPQAVSREPALSTAGSRHQSVV